MKQNKANSERKESCFLLYEKSFFKYKNGMGTIWRREGGEEEKLVDRQKE